MITKKETILNAFKTLGFELENLNELGYSFEYEGIHYLWLANSEDDLLSICIPAALGKDDEEELTFYHIMDKVNASLKFIKANAVGDSMWLFYERELLGEEDFGKILPAIILHLEEAYHLMCDDDSEDQEESDTEEVNTEEEHYNHIFFDLPD